MANFGDMYKMEEMTDPAKGLNEPTSLALIYEDPDDNKKVYQQLDAKMKAKIKQKAKEEEKKKEKAKRDAEAKAKQAQEQAKAKEPEKAQAKQDQAKQDQAKQDQAKQDQAKQDQAKKTPAKKTPAKQSSAKKPTPSSGTKDGPPPPDPSIPDPPPPSIPDDPPPPPLPDVSTDLSEFIGGKKILLISDFEGTTPKTHFEKFSEYCTDAAGKSVVFLGDVFDNTAQPDKTCDGFKCPDPDEKDPESCITPENYCSLRTIRLLVDNPANCRYVVGNRDVNKIKLLPFFALASGEKWWRKGTTYPEIVKNFMAIKKDESTWLVKTINYFKPFWNKKNYIDNSIWKTDAAAGTTIYKRFELIFGKDPDKGTMAALVTLKSLPDEFMHQQGKNMLDFYKEIDATITESNATNLVLRNEIRATLTITLFMRMLDYAIVEKIELGPTLGKLEGILYNYLSNAKPAYYATYNNDLFLFAHGGITEAFITEKGDGAKKELEKTNWKDVLDLTSGTGSGSASGGGTASGGGSGDTVDPENKIKTSIDIYNKYYFALLSQFFANPVAEVDKEEKWKPMLSLLKLTAGIDPATKYYPNQIKEPSYANLDAYRKNSGDSEYARVFNIFGHAAASSGYSFGRARDKDNVIVGENTYFLATDYSTTLFKAGIACDKDKYDTNYLICILDTTTETETKLFIDGNLFLKNDKYHFDYYNKSDFETIKSIDEKLNDKMTAAPFLMIPMGLQEIENQTIDIKFYAEINLLKEIEEIDKKNKSAYCKFNGIARFDKTDYAVYSNMYVKNMPNSIVLMPLIPASTPSLELEYKDSEIMIHQGSDIKKYKIKPPADPNVKYINFESDPATILGFVLDKNTGTLKSIDPGLQKEKTFPLSVKNYTITAENQFGRKSETAKTTIKINIVVSDTDVTYKDIEGLVGKAIGSVLPDKTGDTAKNIKLKYAVSDLNPLPDGLTFNTDTGEISGTPEKYTPEKEYQITATDQFGYDDPVKVKIKIKEKLNIKVEYYDNAIFTGIVGTDIGLVSPTVTGSTPENSRLTYALVDPLPKGLELNPFTGKIYGIPTVITPEKTYQINVTDQLGNADPVEAIIQITIKNPMDNKDIKAVRRGPRGREAILGEEREWAAPVVPEPVAPEPVAPEPEPAPPKRKVAPPTKPKPVKPAAVAAAVVAPKTEPVTPISSENPLMSNESLFSSLRDFLLSLYDPNYIKTNLINPNYILRVNDLEDNFLGLIDEIKVQDELLKVFPIEKEREISSNWYNIYKTQIESKNNESKYPDVIKNIYEEEKKKIPLKYKPVQLIKLKADYIKAIKSHIIDFTMSEYRLRKNKSWSPEAIKSSAVMQKLGGGGTKKHTTKKHTTKKHTTKKHTTKKHTTKKHKKTMKKRVTKRKKNKRQRDKKNKSQKRKLIKKKKKTLQLLFGKKLLFKKK